MAFIDKADYGDAINENILDDITDGVDTKLDSAEAKAISYMKGYLNNRYDVAEIFAQTDNDRHPVVLMFAVDISIYYLHRMLSWRDTPKFRIERYNEAKEWLEKVSKLEINDPLLPLVADDTTREYVQFGGNTKRANHLDDADTE